MNALSTEANSIGVWMAKKNEKATSIRPFRLPGARTHIGKRQDESQYQGTMRELAAVRH